MREQRVSLDAIEQSRIEAVAGSKGLACSVCGSRDLFSGEVEHRIFRRGAWVEMRCGNGSAHHGSAGGAQELALSPEEALRVGLG